MKNLDIPKRLVNPLLELIQTETENDKDHIVLSGDLFCETVKGTDITMYNGVWHVPGIDTKTLRKALEEAGWEINEHTLNEVKIPLTKEAGIAFKASTIVG